MVQEHLIAEEIGAGCTYTTEWVAVCPPCATPAEQKAATRQDACEGCEQPLLLPARYRRAKVAVCSNRCAQRCRRRSKRQYRPSIPCLK
jgi:hypothetical protein